MKRKKRNSEQRSIRLAFLFFIFVVVFIVISLVFRLGILIANSKFDSANRFTVKVVSGKDIMILSFAPRSQSIHKLEISRVPKRLNINKFLAIPIDGTIEVSFDTKERKMSELMKSFLLNYGSLKTDINIIDILRLYLFEDTVPKHYVLEEMISTSLSSREIDKIIARLFKDEVIGRENAIIEVVNTTNVVGLGARLARLVSNMGGNVGIVKSSDKTKKKSTISYFGKKNYTVEKLEKILGYSTNQMTTKTIADIVILIGMDSIGTETF